MYIVIFHYDIPPLSYWLQLTDRNFILQGRFIKSFKDSSLKLYRTPGLTRGFLYTKKRHPFGEAAEKVSIHFINRYRCHTLASVPIFLYNRSREPTINQK